MHEWLRRIDQHFPVRYTVWMGSALGLLLFSFTWVAFDRGGALALLCLFLSAWAGATRTSAATQCCATTRSSGTCAS